MNWRYKFYNESLEDEVEDGYNIWPYIVFTIVLIISIISVGWFLRFCFLKIEPHKNFSRVVIQPPTITKPVILKHINKIDTASKYV